MDVTSRWWTVPGVGTTWDGATDDTEMLYW